jgi:hypothetical protein
MPLSRLATVLLGCVVASAAVVRADGTLNLTVGSFQFNPCNNESVRGTVDAHLVVQVNKNTGRVKVHRSFHGTLSGNQGNTYQISSVANDFFDAPQPFYDVEYHNNVIGLGDAPDFEVWGRTQIHVNANQEPIGYAAHGHTIICK